jgi:hypothetical protein
MTTRLPQNDLCLKEKGNFAFRFPITVANDNFNQAGALPYKTDFDDASICCCCCYCFDMQTSP